jgi:hypothetical protein|nr:MAG TPA: hypothetical protein [Caudoviricetes sp.]
MAIKEKVENNKFVVENTKQEQVKQAEAIYTAEELSANSIQLFGVQAECVTVALRISGINNCTVLKAREIVQEFLKKEIV